MFKDIKIMEIIIKYIYIVIKQLVNQVIQKQMEKKIIHIDKQKMKMFLINLLKKFKNQFKIKI